MSAADLDDVVIIDAVRTPIGRYGGALKDVRPDDLGALVIRSLIDRNPQVPVDEIEDVLLGCANQAGEDNRNVARMSALLAKLPLTVGGGTVNRLCGSGLMAVNDAVNNIKAGNGDIFIAGGVESMTRAPFVMAKSESAFGRDPQIYDTTLGWRFTNKQLAELHYPFSMGETAENVAEKYNVKREDQDAFAYYSQQKYKKRSTIWCFYSRNSTCADNSPQEKGRGQLCQPGRASKTGYKPCRSGQTQTCFSQRRFGNGRQ